MFNIYNDLAPAYLCKNFKKLNNTHTYSTRRNAYGFYLPTVKGDMSKSFCIQGIKDWNNLPVNIQSCLSVNSFKQYVKKYLTNKACNENLSEYIFY